MPAETYSCDDFVNVKEHQDLAVGYFDFDIYAVRKSNYSNYPIHYHDFYKISKSDFNHFPDNFDHLKNNVCIIGDYLLCNDFKKSNYPDTPTGLREVNTFTKEKFDSIDTNVRYYHCRKDFTNCKGGKHSTVGYFGEKEKKLYALREVIEGFPRGNDIMSFYKISEQELNDFPQNEDELLEKFRKDFKKYHLVDDYTTWTFTEEDYHSYVYGRADRYAGSVDL